MAQMHKAAMLSRCILELLFYARPVFLRGECSVTGDGYTGPVADRLWVYKVDRSQLGTQRHAQLETGKRVLHIWEVSFGGQCLPGHSWVPEINISVFLASVNGAMSDSHANPMTMLPRNSLNYIC